MVIIIINKLVGSGNEIFKCYSYIACNYDSEGNSNDSNDKQLLDILK